MSDSTQVPAALRTLTLLETLATAPDGMTAGELLEALDIARSSLFALLNTLKTHGYVQQQGKRGRYRIGPALWAIAPAPPPGRDPLREAFHSDEVLGDLNETVALAAAEVGTDGDDTIIIAQRESTRPVRSVLRVGLRRPAGDHAAGLVLLAGQDDADAYRQIREQGMALTEQEDSVEIAYPICPDGHQPTVALLLSVPRYRWQPDPALFNTLRACAARLSHRLGAPAYRPYGRSVQAPLGPTTPLTRPEMDEFLAGAWAARLACVRGDGTPHVVPLWYEWDGQAVWIMASPQAKWGEYVHANPAVSLTVDEPWPPLRRVFVSGRAQSIPEDAVPPGLGRRLATRTLGHENAPHATDPAGWQPFRVTPDKLIGWRGLG